MVLLLFLETCGKQTLQRPYDAIGDSSINIGQWSSRASWNRFIVIKWYKYLWFILILIVDDSTFREVLSCSFATNCFSRSFKVANILVSFLLILLMFSHLVPASLFARDKIGFFYWSCIIYALNVLIYIIIFVNKIIDLYFRIVHKNILLTYVFPWLFT